MKYLIFCCFGAIILHDVFSETTNCKLRDYDNKPGSACDCGENTAQSICYVSKVRFQNGSCGSCPSGNYFDYSIYDCQECPRPNHNCEENVYRDCRPCEKNKFTTITTKSTTASASTPSISSTSSYTSTKTSSTKSVASTTTSPQSNQVKSTTEQVQTIEHLTTTSSAPYSDHNIQLTNLDILFISIAVVVIVG
uniref:uncharacterized protein LOC120341626 n=1 Tax=Styela clava TaxID=7725 RepID=UPI001939640E|nr:uncharacterized protein LOC120341626 [Styela clava]